MILKGWWGAGAALLPERKDEKDGFRVVRPFSFVQEPNPSLGWPAWSALTALVVDQGWIAATAVDSVVWSRARDLGEAVVVVGIVWSAPGVAPSLLDTLGTWKQPLDDSGPYGARVAPFVIESLLAQ